MHLNLVENQAHIKPSPEQLAELHILRKQYQQLAININLPLTNVLFQYTPFAILYLTIPKPEKLIEFITSLKEIIEYHEKENPEIINFLGYALGIASLVSIPLIILSAYKLYSMVEKLILKYFPNGILNIFSREEIDALAADVDSYNKSEVKELINDLKRQIKILSSTSNKVIWVYRSLTLLGLTGLLPTSTAIKLIFQENSYLPLTKEVYQAIKKQRTKCTLVGNIKNHLAQLNSLVKISLNDENIPAWEEFDSNQAETSRFSLTINKPLNITHQGLTYQISPKTYLHQLQFILSKIDWVVLSYNSNSIIVGLGAPIKAKRINSFANELTQRLHHCYQVKKNRAFKEQQLNTLIATIVCDSQWNTILYHDTNKLPVCDFRIVSAVISKPFKDDFLNKLALLFGNDNIVEQNGSLIVKGHQLADTEQLQATIDELSRIKFKTISQPTNKPSRPKVILADDDLEFQDVIHRKSKRWQTLDEKEEKMNSQQANPTSSATILSQLKTNLGNNKIYPMFVPWEPSNTRFAVIDPQLETWVNAKKQRKKLAGFVLVEFEQTLRNGHVIANGTKTKASSTGQTPATKVYMDIHGQTRVSDYQAKRTNNFRLLGTSSQVEIGGVKRNIVTYNGVRLGHT